MTIKTMYRYTRPSGGVTVSPERPEGLECTQTYRLIADDGMVLTDGTVVTTCIDTDVPDNWSQIPDPEAVEDAEKEDMRAALAVLNVTNESGAEVTE